MSLLSTLGLFLWGPGDGRPTALGRTDQVGDEILPLHCLDDTAGNRSLLLAWTMRFDDVLDPHRLHFGLARLLHRQGWRKLGGRLRMNVSGPRVSNSLTFSPPWRISSGQFGLITDRAQKGGKLEVHVPRVFTQQRPAVGFSHAIHEMRIDEHPLASQLPRNTPHASTQAGSDHFKPLAMRQGAPSKLKDFLSSDAPQLTLHIVSFHDATLVTLSWLHLTTDGMGIRSLVEAWCQVLAGRDEQVPPFMGFAEDPLDKALGAPLKAEPPREPWVLQGTVLAGLGFVLFVIRFLWELVFGPKPESHMLYIPAHTMRALRDRALIDLQSGGALEETTQTERGATTSSFFLSENDVLTAWLTRCVCASRSRTSSRGVTVVSMFEFRSRLPQVFDPMKAYVTNCMSQVWTLLTLREVAEMPLGHLAARIRATLLEQTSVAQTLAQVRLQTEALKGSGRVPIAGQPGCWLVTFSNWSKMRFFDVVDFSPAIIDCKSTTSPFDIPGAEEYRRGRPAYLHSIPISHSLPVRNTVNVMGKDATGNYWIMAVLDSAAWSEVEAELNELGDRR